MRLHWNAHLVEINKKRAKKSHTSSGDYNEGLANLNEQTSTFNSFQQQRNAQKDKVIDLFKRKEK
ncbi:hypothetical protein Hanom_Chr03g00209411 [Helianthus anomalus]